MTNDRKPLGEYAIQGGAAEEHRLAVLAQVMSGATTRLFGEIGVTDGWVCLDVGSGGGQVSMALAGLVAPSGSVTGVDIGETAVVHAAASARKLGVENVRFEQADAAALPYQDRFDLAYARLLLCYLTEPVAALRQMAEAVRPGGVVAVEDVFTDTLRSEPATPALDDLRRIYGATVRAHGGDPTIIGFGRERAAARSCTLHAGRRREQRGDRRARFPLRGSVSMATERRDHTSQIGISVTGQDTTADINNYTLFGATNRPSLCARLQACGTRRRQQQRPSTLLLSGGDVACSFGITPHA